MPGLHATRQRGNVHAFVRPMGDLHRRNCPTRPKPDWSAAKNALVRAYSRPQRGMLAIDDHRRRAKATPYRTFDAARGSACNVLAEQPLDLDRTLIGHQP
jgi:hypothetical protein